MQSRTMSVRTLAQAIGARVLVSFPIASAEVESLNIARTRSVGVYCIVEDVRKVYDRIDLLVRPESGCGSGWVSLSRVERTAGGVCDFAPALSA